jgi:hypothetical protein
MNNIGSITARVSQYVSDTESEEDLDYPIWSPSYQEVRRQRWPHHKHMRLILTSHAVVYNEKELHDLVATAKAQHFRSVVFAATFRYLKRTGVVRKQTIREQRQLQWVAGSASDSMIAYMDNRFH